MDVEKFEWVSLVIGNIAAWFTLLWMVKTLLNRAKHTEDKADLSLEASDRLIDMHEHADENGFGTKQLMINLKKAEEERARSNRELIHYMRWMVERVTGQKPDPFVDNKGR